MSKDTTIQLGEEKMTTYEFARWAALYEAVTLIAQKCEDKGINFDDNVGLKYIKPLDIQDYVNSRTDTMMLTIEKSREFERNNTILKIETIKKHIYDFSHRDIGLPI